jgi:signal transduction histidine kinase
MPVEEQELEMAAGCNLNQEISRRLHDTAQPLTVLQGMLELALLKARTVEEYRDYCQQAIEELQRVTNHFDRVRELMRGNLIEQGR